jgi:OOP family OmpA-OmpF porin
MKLAMLLATLVVGCADAPKPVATAPIPVRDVEPSPLSPEPDKKFEIRDGALVTGPVTFKTGSDIILPESHEALGHVADYLAESPAVSTLRIEVHTDSTGTSGFNAAISERRALAVARWLVSERGVDCHRLIAVGFGSEKPIGDNATPQGKAANRRTVFVLAALRGKAIGGMPLEGGGRVAGDACG